MRTLLLCCCMLIALGSYSQSDLVFATHNSYTLEVKLAKYTSGKDHPWQVRFNNVQPAQYEITATVKNSDGSYSKTQTFNLKVADGEEATLFIIPYSTGLELNLANVVKHSTANGTPNTDGDGRYTSYEGKPVFSKADIKDILKSTDRQFSDADKLNFLKSTLDKAWLYTDDVILFLKKFFDENYKVDLAIFAYLNVIDKHRYYKLADSFFFESNYRKVANYVARQK